MSVHHLPRIRSFLIADLVFRQESGKWCIIGVFQRILSRKFPSVHPSLGLFVTLSDASGEYEVRVQFQDAQGTILAVNEGFRFSVEDRLAEVAFGIQTHNLPIPAPGRYFFKIYFNGEPTEEIPVEVKKVEPEGQK